MPENVIVNSIRSIASFGGMGLVAVGGAVAVMTVAIALMVLAIGGGAAAVTAVTGVGLMETLTPPDVDVLLPDAQTDPIT